MQLTGIHHLTAVTGNAPRNHAFYTQTLGLRLVKKTVNQDDVSAYHLFYADGRGSPGTDITFFDWPVEREQRGTHSITRTGLRVAGADTLAWWKQRFQELGVTHSRHRRARRPADARLRGLRGPAPQPGRRRRRRARRPIRGSAAPCRPSTRSAASGRSRSACPTWNPTDLVLTRIMNMTRVRDYATPGNEETRTHVYQMGAGGPAAELHVAVEPNLPPAQPGAGGVHHVAFRIPDADYQAWAERLHHVRMPSSGPVDRFYFRSLYFREPNGILFEIATDGPGFATDEPMDTLGETLSLPPFLEGRRQQIEAGLKPL